MEKCFAQDKGVYFTKNYCNGTFVLYFVSSDTFRMDIVEYINVFRRIHGVGPVILSDDITSKAQKWALYISSLGTGKTDATSPYGKTICLRYRKRKNLAKECVYDWYNTVKDYDWQDNTISTKSMNFVQMIWMSSLRVGVGVVRGGRGRFYVVVYYDEPGNKPNEMKDNVPGFTGMSSKLSIQFRVTLRKAVDKFINNNFYLIFRCISYGLWR